MVKVLVSQETYKLCEKCGTHRKPADFKVKGKNRKACIYCRSSNK